MKINRNQLFHFEHGKCSRDISLVDRTNQSEHADDLFVNSKKKKKAFVPLKNGGIVDY